VHLANYLDALQRGEATLGAAFDVVGQGHARDAGVYYICRLLSGQCQAHTAELATAAGRYADRREDDLDRLHVPGIGEIRGGGDPGLLRDLQDLYLIAAFVDTSWMVVGQVAQGLRDRDLLGLAHRCQPQTQQQLRWIRSQLSSIAPQALIAA
jgi:hypothetical protein